MRRSLSHAFSDKALRAQEPIVQKYVDLLVQRLHENSSKDGPIDMISWYNYTTFDIIADLTFGEPLYCLRDSNYHRWTYLVFGAIKASGLTATSVKYILFGTIDKHKNVFDDHLAISLRTRKAYFALAGAKVTARLEKGIESRPDFFNFINRNQEKEVQALTRLEMDSNAVIFLSAGTETAATALSGTTYLLLTHKDVYSRLVKEVRTTFQKESDITIDAVGKLSFLLACFSEGMRLYPPVPTGFLRIVRPGGDIITGHWVAGGTSVYVSQHATNHSTRNFKNQELFVPDRWLGAVEYQDDNRDAINPFSFGPRNCLGKK